MLKNCFRIKFLEFCVASTVLVSVLYGVTFQEFRRFADAYLTTIEQGRAVSGDRGFYIAMSEKLISDTPANWRNYRIIVPWMVYYSNELAEKAIGQYAPDTRRQIQFSIKQVRPLLFYVYNFLFFYLAMILFYIVLRNIGFDFFKSLLGASMVASSRVVSYSIGSPLIDSVFYCAVSFIIFLLLCERSMLRTKLLFLIYPAVMISKEMIVPIAALPFLLKQFRAVFFVLVFLISVAGYFVLRVYIDSLYEPQAATTTHQESLFFMNILAAVLPAVPSNLRAFLSFSGLDHLLHGFIFFVPMALIGAFVPSKLVADEKLVLNGLAVIAMGYAIVSYESGRMLFAAFPTVIIYTLIFLEWVERRLRRANGRLDAKLPPTEAS